MYEIAVDIGGTFADFVVRDKQGQVFATKIPSQQNDPIGTMLGGLRELARKFGLTLGEFLAETDKFVHGTTVGINALLQGQGAKTALITTEGFRDALELRRSQLSEQWNFGMTLPPVLVPRYLRIGLRERMDYRGVPLKALDRRQIPEIAEYLLREEVESVAVCLLFACRNPAHEREFKECLQERLPAVFISLSSEISSQLGEYERTSTTVLNARLSPVLSNYLSDLSAELGELGLQSPIAIAQNNGGLTDVFQAKRKAVCTLFSGPAGGVKGGWALARELGIPDLVVADMGGTSFDVSLIRQGEMEIAPQAEVAGYPVQLPMLDIHTVGAGGGSIAWLDPGGMLRVGPHSAGANPGPACYGLGGAEPTLTDAALVLGLIDGYDFLGGRMALDLKQALTAIESKLAQPLGLSVQETAYAIYQVALSRMIDAVYLMTIKKGYDPRLFSLAAVGGALPMFATSLAAGVGIRRVVIPEQAPVFCAQGLHYAPFQVETLRSVYEPLDERVDSKRKQMMAELKTEADQELSRLGVPEALRSYSWSADLKYPDQHHELNIEMPGRPEEPSAWRQLGEAFHARHQTLYGYCQPDKEPELVNLRLLGKEKDQLGKEKERIGKEAEQLREEREPIRGGKQEQQDGISETSGISQTADPEKRTVYLNGEFQSIRCYCRQNLRAGMVVKGPALIRKEFSTVLLEESCLANIDQDGNLLISIGGEGRE